MDIQSASIWDVLPKHLRTGFRFVRPTPGQGLVNFHDQPTESGPASTVMAIRKLRLERDQVIPFHVHSGKEKLYYYLGDPEGKGSVEVLVYEGEALKKYPLKNRGDRFLVSVGTIHAVICYGPGHGYRECEILVVASTKNGEDVVWEPQTDELLKNERFSPA